ncbi:phosphoglucosamine mutase [Candidatus Saccharibacteria bacterium]|nr:phosphoglucosamine mutase [Candidatus Saccharibacteria bacterium]
MKYFGTDGIRQPSDKFTPEFVTSIVKGLSDYAGNTAKVLIAGDTRESTEWILADLESALETFGLDYGNAGVLPTPAINYCFPEMGFDYAIDVTASHNPYTDNGIKIFERSPSGTGVKLSKKGREVIESSLESGQTYTLVSPTIREDLHTEAVTLYQNHLIDYLGSANFADLNIGMDCANGATSVINKNIFEQFGANVTLININDTYNTNINKDCGSTHLGQLQHLVTTNSLDFGVAFDGDGDRVLMVDHAGNIVDGDQIIAILAEYLHLDSIAVSVMANQGLLNWASSADIRVEITPVGDSNVAEAMQKYNIPIGGEQSGHIILPGEATGDGMLTALMVTKAVAATGKSLQDLAAIMAKSPQVNLTMSATPAQKSSLATSDVVKSTISQFEQKVKSVNGRLLVRPSGTEPLIRITIWGDDEKTITALAEELKEKLSKNL